MKVVSRGLELTASVTMATTGTTKTLQYQVLDCNPFIQGTINKETIIVLVEPHSEVW